jgi:hypothetical protein
MQKQVIKRGMHVVSDKIAREPLKRMLCSMHAKLFVNPHALSYVRQTHPYGHREQ